MKPIEEMSNEEIEEHLKFRAEHTQSQKETDKSATQGSATQDWLNKAQKQYLKNEEPVPVPKEYLWAGGAAGLAIIVTAWPALILGAILGAFAVFKAGCPNRRD